MSRRREHYRNRHLFGPVSDDAHGLNEANDARAKGEEASAELLALLRQHHPERAPEETA